MRTLRIYEYELYWFIQKHASNNRNWHGKLMSKSSEKLIILGIIVLPHTESFSC